MRRTKTLSGLDWELSTSTSLSSTDEECINNSSLIQAVSMIKDVLTSGSVNINIHVYHHYDD